jgi:hypothetical protein
MLTAARLVFVVVWFPAMWVVDRFNRIDPPARLRTGIDWARGEKP